MGGTRKKIERARAQTSIFSRNGGAKDRFGITIEKQTRGFIVMG